MKILFCDNSLRELVNFREKVFDDFAEKGHDIVLLAPKIGIMYPNTAMSRFLILI